MTALRCPMCQSETETRCCVVTAIRLGLVLLCLGWEGPVRRFHREAGGWRLGGGLVVMPWMHGEAVPDDPWEALEQIEHQMSDEIIYLMRDFRRRLDAAASLKDAVKLSGEKE